MYVKLKKKFGQNFLVDKNISRKVLKLLPAHTKKIIEIGPGIGHLTDFLLNDHIKKLTLIEIDSDFLSTLDEKYKNTQHERAMKAPINKPLDEQLREKGLL